MLTQRFFNDLELRLSTTLSTAGRYWCDGVLGPEWESDWKPEHVAQSHQLILRAWIEEGRSKGQASTQAQYRLVLHLGSESLSTYLRTHTLPGKLLRRIQPAHLALDASSKTLAVQLP
jgi:hypothetical protein